MKDTLAPVSAPKPGGGAYSCERADKDGRAVPSTFSGSAGDLVSLKRSGWLCTLWQVHPERKEIIPVGRSYGGNDWEPYSGKWSQLKFNCNGESCSVTLPDLPDRYFYELVAFDYDLPRHDEIARFLEQASFGPTRNAIKSFPNSFATWIQEQQALPLTSHRKFFRERATMRTQRPDNMGIHSHPCKRGARYRRYALTEVHIRTELEISTDDPTGRKILSFGGEVLTVLNTSVLFARPRGKAAIALPDGM